jgi:hypothetical protein
MRLVPRKKGIEISLSPEAIERLEAKAQLLGYRSKSALVEAWALGKIDADISQSAKAAQAAIDNLTNIIGTLERGK